MAEGTCTFRSTIVARWNESLDQWISRRRMSLPLPLMRRWSLSTSSSSPFKTVRWRRRRQMMKIFGFVPWSTHRIKLLIIGHRLIFFTIEWLTIFSFFSSFFFEWESMCKTCIGRCSTERKDWSHMVIKRKDCRRLRRRFFSSSFSMDILITSLKTDDARLSKSTEKKRERERDREKREWRCVTHHHPYLFDLMIETRWIQGFHFNRYEHAIPWKKHDWKLRRTRKNIHSTNDWLMEWVRMKIQSFFVRRDFKNDRRWRRKQH